MTYEHGGKQYVGVLSGVGGWAGIGLAAGLTNPNEGLGAVGGYAALSDYTELGGQLTVFELPGGGTAQTGMSGMSGMSGMGGMSGMAADPIAPAAGQGGSSAVETGTVSPNEAPAGTPAAKPSN